MRPLTVFLLLLLTSGIACAQEPAWWIQQKKDCHLDSRLAYNTWVAQGSPCNKATPAANSQSTNTGTELTAKEEADKKATYEAEQKAIAEAEAKKKKEEEEQKEKEKQDVLKRMNATSTQSFGLSTSPDFDGLKGSQPNTYGLNSSAANTTVTTNNLPTTDPMVVDARNVPSGLSKDIEKSIDAIYKDAPAGVKEKVKKAFQSVQVKDWKVAKAWFQEALKLEPNNKGLQTFVVLCDYSYEKITSASIPDPYFTMNANDQEEINKHFKDLREGKGSWPSPEKIRNYINSISLDDYIKRYNLVMPEKDDINYLFPENKGSFETPFDIMDFDTILQDPANKTNSPNPKTSPKKISNPN